MDFTAQHLFNRDVWNQRVINIYWILFAIYVAVQFLYLFVIINTDASPQTFIINRMIFPDILLAIVLIGTHLIYRQTSYDSEILLIWISAFMSCLVVVSADPSIHGVPSILILPLLVSITYFNRKMLMTMTVFSILFFIANTLVNPVHRENVSIFDFILYIGVLLSCTVAGLGILRRSRELIGHLEKLIQSEQKLIIENALINKLSKTDALTELYNHKTFHEHLDRMVEQCEANSIPLQLAIIDIDNFKNINDTYGHSTGDLVLKKVAEQMKTSVLHDDFISRYGGEEFAIVFMRNSLNEAFTVVESLRQRIASYNHPQLDNKAITVSIGLHEYKKGEYKKGLFNTADSMLYTAKKSGKNKVVVG